MQITYKKRLEVKMNCIDGKHSAECVLVTLKKITELTGIPVGTLRSFRASGMLPSLSKKFGRLIVGRLCEVQRDLDNVLNANV